MAGFITLAGDDPVAPTGHALWLQKLPRRVTLYFENFVVADTKDALCAIEIESGQVEPVLYLPRNDILADLAPNQTQETCPLKGIACFFDLLNQNGTVAISNAAWSFANPVVGAEGLKNRFAFTKAHFTFEDLPL